MVNVSLAKGTLNLCAGIRGESFSFGLFLSIYYQARHLRWDRSSMVGRIGLGVGVSIYVLAYVGESFAFRLFLLVVYSQWSMVTEGLDWLVLVTLNGRRSSLRRWTGDTLVLETLNWRHARPCDVKLETLVFVTLNWRHARPCDVKREMLARDGLTISRRLWRVRVAVLEDTKQGKLPFGEPLYDSFGSAVPSRFGEPLDMILWLWVYCPVFKCSYVG